MLPINDATAKRSGRAHHHALGGSGASSPRGGCAVIEPALLGRDCRMYRGCRPACTVGLIDRDDHPSLVVAPTSVKLDENVKVWS